MILIIFKCILSLKLFCHKLGIVKKYIFLGAETQRYIHTVNTEALTLPLGDV